MSSLRDFLQDSEPRVVPNKDSTSPPEAPEAVDDTILGFGFDVFKGARKQTPWNEGLAYISTNPLTSVSYTVCESTDELITTLKANSKVGVTYGPIQADAMVDFADSLQITSTSICVAVYSHNEKEVRTVKRPSIPDIVPTPETLKQYFKSFGDSFISSVTFGTFYIAAYIFRTETQQKKSELKANLASKGIFGAGGYTAEIGTQLDKVKKSFSLTTKVDQKMGGVTGKSLPDENEIVKFALQFPSFPPDPTPYILKFEIMGYEDIFGMDGKMGSIPVNRSALLETGKLFEHLDDAKDLHNQIRDIKDIYATYAYDLNNDLRLLKTDVDLADFVQKAQNWILKVDSDPTIVVELPPVPDLTQFPTVDFALIRPMPLGNSNHGGGQMNHPNFEDQVLSRGRIRELKFKSGSYIDHLEVAVDQNGKIDWFINGGGGGGPTVTFSLVEGDYITSMIGWWSDYVNGFILKTKKGSTASTSTTRGNHSDSYDFSANNAAFIGFDGYGGKYIDVLNPVGVKFSPARWTDIKLLEE